LSEQNQIVGFARVGPAQEGLRLLQREPCARGRCPDGQALDVRQVLGQTQGTQMIWPFPPWDGPTPIKDKKEKRDDYPEDMDEAPF
jgi:hypothetical protein